MLGAINNIFRCKASDRLEEEIKLNCISKKVERKILSILERCKIQLAHLRKIDDITFRSELIHERQKHYLQHIEESKYWEKEIHSRWVKSIIVALCRNEIKRR
jgi:hypothetical protein